MTAIEGSTYDDAAMALERRPAPFGQPSVALA